LKSSVGTAGEQAKLQADLERATTRVEIAGKINPALANLLP
jgi:hypothetical protein